MSYSTRPSRVRARTFRFPTYGMKGLKAPSTWSTRGATLSTQLGRATMRCKDVEEHEWFRHHCLHRAPGRKIRFEDGCDTVVCDTCFWAYVQAFPRALDKAIFV